MKFRLFLILFLSFLGAQGCSKEKPSLYQIGVDPSFFPMNLKEQTPNLFAFTNDLLRAISLNQRTELSRINMSWDNLFDGLSRGQYQGVLSSASPNLINQTKYSFSNTYIKTGPVLIVPKQTPHNSLETLAGRVVAMGNTTEELDFMQTYPNVEFVFYTSQIEALEGVIQGKYAACLIPILPAHAYVKDLFQESLMIASDVLTSQAIRLVTLKGQEDPLIPLFNAGLLDLQKNGVYPTLLAKWSLYQSN